jgi:cytochrome c biogenesis protein
MPTHKSNIPREPQAPGVFHALTSFLTSVRTAVALLFLLAAASVLGTVIPQEADPAKLAQVASSTSGRLVVILDLNNVYRSWWFGLLLFLLALSLFACLLKRSRSLLADWRTPTGRHSFNFTLSDSRSPTEVVPLVEAAVTGLMGARPTIVSDHTGASLAYVKHRAHLLAFPLIHTGILLVLAGAVIGLFWGFKGHVLIQEGDTESEYRDAITGHPKRLPFTVAVDRFTLTRYPSGEPKEFRSDVRLLEGTHEALRGAITVNRPLSHQGISLYQSDYRVTGVNQIEIEIVKPDGGKETLLLDPEAPATLPGGFILTPVGVDPGSGGKGAGAEFSLTGPDGDIRKVALYKSDTKPVKVGDVSLRFVGWRPLYATGLQITYDPGAMGVWIGSVVLVAGFLLSLFMNFRRLIVQVRAAKSGARVYVAGGSRRMRKEFREEATRQIRAALGHDTEPGPAAAPATHAS